MLRITQSYAFTPWKYPICGPQLKAQLSFTARSPYVTRHVSKKNHVLSQFRSHVLHPCQILRARYMRVMGVFLVLIQAQMESKCCSKCAHTLPISSFLTDPSNPKNKICVTCIKCRGQDKKCWLKRKALQALNPNIPSKRPAIGHTKPRDTPLNPPPYILSKTHPEFLICPLPPPESCPQVPLLIPPVPKSPP